MNSLLSTQVSVLARRSMRKTLRQPFQLFPIVFFPVILLAVNASGLKSATLLPGFPTHSYVSFAIAVAFLQGAMFALINTGTNLAEDIESGFFNRLALTPLRRVALIAGLLVGVAAVGALQSTVYILIGLVVGAHLDAGFGGALVVIALGSLATVAFGAFGCAAALWTGSGEAVQGLFPLFFVFVFLSSSNLPRNLLGDGWFHTVADWNPISYLIEGFRSLYIYGWDATALWRGFLVAGVLGLIALIAVSSALKQEDAKNMSAQPIGNARPGQVATGDARTSGGAPANGPARNHPRRPVARRLDGRVAGNAHIHPPARPDLPFADLPARVLRELRRRAVCPRESARLHVPGGLYGVPVRVRAVPVGDVLGPVHRLHARLRLRKRLRPAADAGGRGPSWDRARLRDRGALARGDHAEPGDGRGARLGHADHRRRGRRLRPVRPRGAARARRLRLGRRRRVSLPHDPGRPADADAGLPDPVPRARLRAPGAAEGLDPRRREH